MTKRIVRWDLLRALAMFFVVVCHSASYLGPIRGIDTSIAVPEFALICDPVFFALSGYFAIRPLKGRYSNYIFNKIRGVVVPLITYTLCLLALNVITGRVEPSLGACLGWSYDIISGGYWFVPTLIPYLVLAPFLFEMFSSLSDKTARHIEAIVYVAFAWGIAASLIRFASSSSSVSSFVLIATTLVPPTVVPGGYFVYFSLGYFIRREEDSLKSGQHRALVLLGLAAWIACPVLAVLGYQRPDPSYLWFLVTVSVFGLFAHIDVRSERISGFISFLARHSYGVYLLQYTSIDLVYGRMHLLGLLDGSGSLPGLNRLCLQLFAVLSSYVLAIVTAAVLDGTVVKFANKLLAWVFGSAG